MLKTILFVVGAGSLYFYLSTLNMSGLGDAGAEVVTGAALYASTLIYGLYYGG
jgi:hypothetical protein